MEAALEVSRKEVSVARQTANIDEKRKRKTSEDEAGALRVSHQICCLAVCHLTVLLCVI